MDNQHQKITGYRDLTQAEIELMNKIKEEGERLEALITEVLSHVRDTGALPHEHGPASQAVSPFRWAAMASTNFQTGLMFLTRAVARPSSF